MRISLRLLSFAALAALACAAGADTYKLLAATTDPTTKPVVRLRWLPDEGWLPDGGFNLYRTGADGKAVKLNDAPILPNAQTQADPAFQLAKGSTATPTEHIVRKTDANNAAAFQALRAVTQAAYANKAAPSAATVEGLVANDPTVKAYYDSLRPPTPPSATPTEPDKVTDARGSILFVAALVPQAAKDFGLAFDDDKATAGETYTYELRPIVGGAEGTPAKAQIVAAKDPLPPTPKVDEPVQRNAIQVDLRWEPPTDAEEDRLGLVTYDVFRTDSKHATPVKLTDDPIVIGFVPTKDGKSVPTLVTFSDKGAKEPIPVGPLTYTVVAHDTLGRDSAAATTTVTFEDWAAPVPVPAAVAAQALGKGPFHETVVKGQRVPDPKLGPGPDSVSVAWAPSRKADGTVDADAVYRVYRIDAEQTDAPAVLLTPTPVAGGAVESTGLTLGQALAIGIVDKTALGAYATGRGKEISQDEIDTPLATFLTTVTDAALVTDAKARFAARSYTDASAPRDHYYVYAVVSEYARNDRQTPPTGSTAFPWPLLTPPPAPTGLGSALQPPSSLPASDPQSDAAQQKKAGELRQSAEFAHVREASIGTVVALNWTAVAGKDVIYRVYRANLTGRAPGSDAFQKVRKDVTDGDYDFLNSATAPSYLDATPVSQATTYRYRVTAVNRWGVEGDIASLDVRVAATMGPSIPSLLAAEPNDQGHVVVKIQPNAAEEEVAQYVVYRKDVTPAPPRGGSRFGLVRRDAPLIATAPGGSVTLPGVMIDLSAYTAVGTIDQDPDKAPESLIWEDASSVPGKAYLYRVVALNKDKVPSNASTILDASPVAPPAAPPTGGGASLQDDGTKRAIHLTWTAPAAGASGYLVRRAIDRGDGNLEFVQVAVLNGDPLPTSFDDVTGRPKGKYVYRISTLDASGGASERTDADGKVTGFLEIRYSGA